MIQHLTDRRAEIPAHYDLWMRGDRFGTVVKTTRTHVHIRLDRTQWTIRIPNDTFDTFAKLL